MRDAHGWGTRHLSLCLLRNGGFRSEVSHPDCAMMGHLALCVYQEQLWECEA